MPDGDRFGVDLRRLYEGKQVRNVPIQTKSVESNDDFWTVKGVASTPRVDRMGDIVDPMGAKFSLPVKLLLNHQNGQVIGNVIKATKTRNGIDFEARIPKVKEDGTVKTRITEAVHSLQYELIDSTSIGFNPNFDKIELIRDDKNDHVTGLRFTEWEWLELSLVPIPANPEARITQFKAIDERLRLAVPGRNTRSTSNTPAGASAITTPKGNTMHAKLAGLVESRKTSAARMAELAALKEQEKRGYTETETTEIDMLDVEIKELDRDIKVASAQIIDASTATPVETKGARAPYGFVRKQDPDDKFEGQSEVRRVMCRIQSTIDAKQGIFRNAWEIAEQRYGKTHPNLVAVMKTGVAGAGSGSGEALAEFVSADNRFTGDFIDYLYAQTVFDRLPLREVPANVAIKGLDGAYTAYFVGESKGIPASQGSGSTTSTTPLKVAALTVLSNELIRDSSPSAEKIARDGLVEAHRQKVDSLFLSATAASSGVSPAGILNGVAALSTSGNTAADVLTDIGTMEDTFTTANYNGELSLVMRKTMAGSLGRMRSTLGIFDFPGLTRNGGALQGMTVYAGGNVGPGDIIMLDPQEIWKIGDRGVQISVSQDAMIEQDTAPQGATDTPAAASATMVSMFQEESTAIKLVRPINWGKRRSGAVAWIGNATYGDATT